MLADHINDKDTCLTISKDFPVKYRFPMTGRQAGFSFLRSLPDLCTHATERTDRLPLSNRP